MRLYHQFSLRKEKNSGIVAIPVGAFYIGAVPFVKDFEALTVGAVLMCVAVPGIISALFYYRKFHIKRW